MKIELLSIVAGTAVCNARCPFCISKMTPRQGVNLQEPEVNWRNFKIACRLAETSGVNNVMITSKGESTLYPNQITKYLEHLKEFNFPLIEMQTNGIIFWEKKEEYQKYLKKWYELGLTTIAISIVHYKEEKNKEIYSPHKDSYINLPAVIKNLHDIGFSVRFSCIMAKGYIDSVKEVNNLIKFSKENKVEQLTIRRVDKPQHSENKIIDSWTSKHFLTQEFNNEIQKFLETNGNKIRTLQYGGIVYDLRGQNVCLTNCLTYDQEGEYLRQLIFFPDGHLRHDWQFEGAIIL